MTKGRIGTAFHETFALNLPAIAAVLRVCNEHEGEANAEIIRSETSLGANYVRSMPMYARGAGLLELNSYRLTPFGQTVMMRDPDLMRVETQWLMHYFLSAPNGPGPAFWNALISTSIRIGQTIRRTDIATAIAQHLQNSSEKLLGNRTLESTATVFLGSYEKSDALGKLGVLAGSEEGSGAYEVSQPESPPIWVIGCALADYWEASSAGASELLLKDLGRSGGFAGLFFMGTGMLGAILSDLQSAGVLAIKRDAPPFVVTRLWRDGGEMIKHLYE